MGIAISLLRAGGSCFTVEEAEEGFYLHLARGDRANFNILVRRMLNEVSTEYVAFARPDGFGGYDSVQIGPLPPTD